MHPQIAVDNRPIMGKSQHRHVYLTLWKPLYNINSAQYHQYGYSGPIGSCTVWVNINKRFIIDKVLWCNKYYGATFVCDEYFKLTLKKEIALWNEINVNSKVCRR